MHGCPRVDVMEGKDFFVFIDFFAGYLASHNFAKNTVGIGMHA